MCSSPNCRVEVLPDGQVDEYHEFTEEDLFYLVATVKKMNKTMVLASYAQAYPHEEVFYG